MIELERLLARLPVDAADAVIGLARPKSSDLARHLRETLGAPAGSPGSMLSEPFIEGAFPWLAAKGGWDGLEPGLLHERARDVLREVSFPPYVHQVDVWRHLCAETPSSVIVSSGTGSGKTECFLTPILDRLVRLSDGGQRRLTGVRALMLYPLNALIASQEERLSKWLAPFDGNLRYCLYNGETPEDPKASRARQTPWKVDDRTTLRASPPPVLVTNITMLEYMLIRQKDAPILKQSRGKLDFIVLDEAHSYLGAQAAELALLLRRVALAFDRRPEKIRYVATSATIGRRDDDGAELKHFLKDITGAPDELVHVVTGKRAPLPPAPKSLSRAPVELGRFVEAGDGERAEDPGSALAGSARLREAREHLRDGGMLSWKEWEEAAREIAGSSADATTLLVRAASSRDPNANVALAAHGGDAILPVRMHVFHSTMTGLWACVNPACPDRPGGEGDWPFGAVFTESREHCSSCRSIVLEWAYCTSCGDGALRTELRDDGSRVAAWDDPDRDDGFDQTLNSGETYGAEGEDREPARDLVAVLDRRYLTRSTVRQAQATLTIDPLTGVIAEGSRPEGLRLASYTNIVRCPCCDSAPRDVERDVGALRAFRAGAPYLMPQITPGIVGSLSPIGDSVTARPMDGRQLITFTDARQGTARHAANLQVTAERSYIRSVLYHLAQERPPRDEEQIADLTRRIDKLRALDDPDLSAVIPSLEAQLKEAAGGATAKTWAKAVEKLSSEPTVKSFLKSVWEDRGESFSDPAALAEFLLYREIMRRPVRANSAETLGLVRFLVPLTDVGDATLPREAERLGLTLDDWRDLVRLVVTHFLRANTILELPSGWTRWIDRRLVPNWVIRRTEGEKPNGYVRVWPTSFTGASRPTRIVRLVAQGLDLRLEEDGVRDDVEALFDAAWRVLRRYMSQSTEGFRLELSELHLAPVERAWWCPLTRRILDTTFRGLSPYDERGCHPKAERVEMPSLPFPWGRDLHGGPVSSETVEDWLRSDERISGLRASGVWGDQQDRAARFSRWLRTAEHSGQQPSFVLRKYEKEFKEGRINVMACSTTMEMGVDIGSIEAVLNTNAPPAIANYRQRVGRAGRQRQPIALALTLCKDRPLDRQALADPASFLGKAVPAPRVTLESPTIARRHAHALLLAAFLREKGAELHTLTNGRFFGLGLDPDAAPQGFPGEQLVAWLDAPMGEEIVEKLETLLRGTPIATGRDLFDTASERIRAIRDDLQAEWAALAGEQGAEAVKRARRTQRSRLEGSHLLGELAGRGFLPSYGFPTDIVPFVTETAASRRRREEETGDKFEDANRLKARSWPARPRDVAIHEYAPGRSVVVDGVVYESSGVTLNWKRPVDEQGVREVQSIRQVRWCRGCGALTSAPGAAEQPDVCAACGGTELHREPVRYLVPAGFAVDVRYTPHDDTRGMVGGAQVDPWVAASTAAWRALPDPALGQVRSAADGTVFWFNPGPAGHGYEICLRCGRAEPETARNGESKLEQGHKPLRGGSKAADGSCTGADPSAQFAIQRHLSLGHEIRTDVCEVQLYACETREAALAVALALREAVARSLGVDSDEMGFAAPEAPTTSLGRSFSAVVFDRASGGAGFSSEIARDPVRFLEDARDLLDCEASGRCGDPEAVRACPRCVLGVDSQYSAERTDRKRAHALLADVTSKLSLPDDVKLFGDATAYETAPLAQALSERLARDDAGALVVPLSGPPECWDIEDWPLAPTLERWGGRGRVLDILVSAEDLDNADPVTRRRLVRWAERARVTLRQADGRGSLPTWLAAVRSRSAVTAWASRSEKAREIGSRWGADSDEPVVRGPIDDIVLGSEIDLESLHGQVRPRDAVIPVGPELDGPASGFGARLRKLLVARAPELGRMLEDEALTLRYADRYLFSPLAVRLATELVGGFAGETTRVTVSTRGYRPHTSRRRPTDVMHDWSDLRDRDRVLKEVLRRVAPDPVLDLDNALGHSRRLDIVTERGAATIFLDQGVGSWRPKARVGFDHFASHEEQVRRLQLPLGIVNGQSETFIAVRMTP